MTRCFWMQQSVMSNLSQFYRLMDGDVDYSSITNIFDLKRKFHFAFDSFIGEISLHSHLLKAGKELNTKQVLKDQKMTWN